MVNRSLPLVSSQLHLQSLVIMVHPRTPLDYLSLYLLLLLLCRLDQLQLAVIFLRLTPTQILFDYRHLL
jgi:hypothetical protein